MVLCLITPTYLRDMKKVLCERAAMPPFHKALLEVVIQITCLKLKKIEGLLNPSGPGANFYNRLA